MSITKHIYLSLCCLLLLTGNGVFAQNKAAELSRDQSVGLNQSARDDLATIGRYAENVRGRLNEAPDSPPASSLRRTDSMVDPFAVSPQLREGHRPGGSFNGLPSASKLDVQRQIRVKALLVTAFGRVAQLEMSALTGSQAMTVMDGDLVDFGELGIYTVHISATQGITLSTPGSPQGNRITLR
jgi:hypothetical protein